MLLRFLRLWSNISPFRALPVLGWRQYLIYLKSVVVHWRAFMGSRGLATVDGSMAKSLPVATVRFKGRPLQIDLRETDGRLAEPSKTFGSIREMYIRDCYLGDLDHLENLQIGMDLGSNRGLFSTFLASCCQRVICVEPQPQYHDIIRHNMGLNGFSNFQIAPYAVGTSKKLEAFSFPKRSMTELFAEYDLPRIDLLKIDIEGGEFELFAHPEWVDKVGMITMELHPEWGDTTLIQRLLVERGWQVTLRDRRLRRCQGLAKAEFLFATHPQRI